MLQSVHHGNSTPQSALDLTAWLKQNIEAMLQQQTRAIHDKLICDI